MPNPNPPSTPRIVSAVLPRGPGASEAAPTDSRLSDFARRMVVGVLVSVLIVAVAYFCWRGVHVLLQAFAGMLFAVFLAALREWLSKRTGIGYRWASWCFHWWA